jgi:hypothetical protein
MSDNKATLFSNHSESMRLSGGHYENHGKLWKAADLQILEERFAQGATLEDLCKELQRSSGGILPKLEERNLLVWSANNYSYYLSGHGLRVRNNYNYATCTAPTPTSTSTEETEMSLLNANTSKQVPTETITYLYGQPVKSATTDYLISSLNRAQGEISTHKALPENKFSAKRIAEAEAAILLAVAELNTRD